VQYLDIALTAVQCLQRFNEHACKGLDKAQSISEQQSRQAQQAEQVYHTQLHVLKSYQKQRLKCTMKSVLKVTETIHV